MRDYFTLNQTTPDNKHRVIGFVTSVSTWYKQHKPGDICVCVNTPERQCYAKGIILKIADPKEVGSEDTPIFEVVHVPENAAEMYKKWTVGSKIAFVSGSPELTPDVQSVTKL